MAPAWCVAIMLLCAACGGGASGSAGMPSSSAGGTGGSDSLGGVGGALVGGAGGALQSNAGTTASGGGAGGNVTGASGGVGASGSGGVAGSMQASDPCAALPPGCVTVCQAGMCQCDCSGTDPCPAAAPTQDSACNTLELCGYGEPACHQVFECFTAVWKKVADTCADAPAGSCPATLTEALATPCLDRRCGYGPQLCLCASPGSGGAFMPPISLCIGPDPAACLAPRVVGASCLPEGQHCGAMYCGVQFTCTEGKWTSAMIGCPP